MNFNDYVTNIKHPVKDNYWMFKLVKFETQEVFISSYKEDQFLLQLKSIPGFSNAKLGNMLMLAFSKGLAIIRIFDRNQFESDLNYYENEKTQLMNNFKRDLFTEFDLSYSEKTEKFFTTSMLSEGNNYSKVYMIFNNFSYLVKNS